MAEFYDCILTGRAPLSDGNNALDVVRILEKAEQSLKSNGIIIPIA